MPEQNQKPDPKFNKDVEYVPSVEEFNAIFGVQEGGDRDTNIALELRKTYRERRAEGSPDFELLLRDPQKKILERIEPFDRSVVVAHRRLGKTTLLITRMFFRAYEYDLSNRTLTSEPIFAFIAPTIDHAKELAGGILEELAATIPGVKYSKSNAELVIEHNGARIILAGAFTKNKLRGMGFVDVIFDEFAFMAPDVWSDVVRPALEPGGEAVFSSTPFGTNHFYKMLRHAQQDPDWGWVFLPQSDTGFHDKAVMEKYKREDQNAYRREYQCDFQAPVDGSYYGSFIEEAKENGRILNLPHDPRLAVYTAWDIGFSDDNVIWFCQIGEGGRTINVIDYEIDKETTALDWARRLQQKGYRYAAHILPHDGKKREMSSGKSPADFLREIFEGHSGCEVLVMKKAVNVNEAIQRVRTMFPKLYFDEERCQDGLDSLGLYRRKKDAKFDDYADQPHHPNSHTADALRTLVDHFFDDMGTAALARKREMDGGETRDYDEHLGQDALEGIPSRGDVLDGIPN